ncbi:unnamed protein product [Allacma fusca]|uniref:Vacuolar protein sorting-associated protein 18 homolog n=1 Tax=Allacma fusca TaxID=39272 RepID=A0A8J2NTS2_9HEXA|nr:unnamed protein product [Allacma fusca]
MSKTKDKPIFGRQRVNFNPSCPLTHICASNNILVLILQNKILMKIDIKNPEEPTEFDLKPISEDAKLSNLFMDPSGQHILLAFAPRDKENPAELIYLQASTMKPEKISKLKSHSVTSVAWNQSMETTSASSTAPFLLGTSKGLIFEAKILKGDIHYCQQIYDIGKGGPSVISGLEYFFLPKSNKCYIMVATARKLFQFKGFVANRDDNGKEPWFNPIFTTYLRDSAEESLPLGDQVLYPQSDQSTWRLHIHYDYGMAFPKSIGCLTDSGYLMFNNIAESPSTDDNFLKEFTNIRYPKEDDEATSPMKSPKALVITDYHALLLYKNSVKAVCTLNDETAFEDNSYTEKTGKLLNLIRDPIKGSIWCLTERGVFKYIVTTENRNVWQIYLQKQDFEKAKDSCGNDPDKQEVISKHQADYYFAQEKYEMSAMYYAMTKISFEEVALKFVQIDDSHALKMFLEKKLSTLQPHDTTKVTVLVLWIIEIFLNRLGCLRDFGKKESTEYSTWEDEFLKFMKQPVVKQCVTKNKKAVYDLMDSHGDKENLILFTLEMKDYDEVIESNINSGLYIEALTTLQQQKNPSLFSRFIPVLLDKRPKETIDALICSGKMLNPEKLLPKFSSKLDPEIASQVTRYLEHCVHVLKITDQVVHDYLMSLFVHFYSSERLMDYLESQGTDVNRVCYDPKYALMMCLEKKLNLPTVHLYTIMGLYEEAVSLAVQIDLELAKRTADVPEHDQELRKKLWLRIAKHVVKEKNDIQQAMEFLHLCDLLKIEDILPFFPNFVTIDHFKDAICASLQEYNQHIQTLKNEMEEATKAAETIREDILQVRNRCAIVRATDQCTLCGVYLLIKNFYVFPCGHKFHAECLLAEVIPQLSQPRKDLLSEKQKKLSEISAKHDVLSTGSTMVSLRDQIKSDIDEIIASECIYCGDNMIKQIDTPFIPEEDYDKIQKEWE